MFDEYDHGDERRRSSTYSHDFCNINYQPDLGKENNLSMPDKKRLLVSLLIACAVGVCLYFGIV